MFDRFSLRHLSIQKRLPLLMCFLLLTVIVIFSWTTYFQVKESALEAGRNRLGTLTEQLSSMFQQSAQMLIAANRATARQDAVKRYLQSNGNESQIEALQSLEKLRPDSLSVLVELRDSNGKNILTSLQPGIRVQANLDSVLSIPSIKPDSGSVGKMYKVKDAMYYPIISTVTDDNKIIGYIVKWRRVLATPKAVDQLSQLIGTQARLYVGNNDGSLWSDMIKPVSVPPVNKSNLGKVIEYSSANGKRVMAAVRPIAGSNWLVMVEFSRQTILEPANRFLYRIVIIGLILIVAGIFFAWLMSRNITKPLNELTVAASAITGGDYSPAVELSRKDELGKLAEAFNTMAVRVSNAQHDLEKKVLERTTQLETVKAAAEKANRSKTRFLSSMSHEIRTPLNGILGFTEILSRNSLTKEQHQEYLMHIKTAGELLSKLIGDILDLSKIEEGKLVLENESFHVKEFIESSLYPYKFQINENGVDFKMDIDQAIPDYIISDRHRINQVLVNLIGNATKFTREGMIGIKIMGKHLDEENFLLELFVYDTGIGIASDKFEKIFESFSQANETINRDYGGSGLGLAIVKQLVTAMDGKINVISPYPHEYAKGEAGSCFQIQLPVKVDVNRQYEAPLTKITKQTGHLQEKNISVLVVDDNLMNQRLAGFLLEKLGCEVQLAGNGRDALEMIKTNSFNAILMDVHMPVMDGFEATQKIRNELHLDTPIIGVTANVFRDDIDKCINAGMNDHLGKPYREDQLLDKISKWV